MSQARDAGGVGPVERRTTARPARGPEHAFAGLVAVFGVVFAFGMPPTQVADEPSHLHRAYHLSEGYFVPEQVGEWGGGGVPRNVLRIADTFAYLSFHPERQTSGDDFASLWSLPLEPEKRDRVPFPGSAYYSFVPYAPQAVGVFLARALGGGPLALFYAGRLANLAAVVVLVFWAVRITPVFKLVFGTVALLPISVHQFASFSPDACTIGVAFLLVALLFRLAFAGGELAGACSLLVLVAVGGWLALCKFPYAVLTLFYGAVPPSRVGGWRPYLLTGAALFGVTFGLAFEMTQLKKYTPDRLVPAGEGTSIEKQVEIIKALPWRYAKVCLATVAEHGKIWIDHLAWLGWLDTRVNPLAMHAFLVFLVIVGLGDRTEGIEPSLWSKLVGLLAAALGMLVIMTCCYVCGCPLKAKLIPGVQGRYFIPFLPFLMLPLYNRSLRVQAPPRLLFALAASASAGTLVVAVASFVRRYYYPAELQLRLDPAALAVAGVLFGLAFLFARGKGAPEPGERTGGTAVLGMRLAGTSDGISADRAGLACYSAEPATNRPAAKVGP